MNLGGSPFKNRNQVIEDESHVLLHCPLYADIRCNAIRGICQITADFTTLLLHEQFVEMMSNPLYYKIVSKAMYYILNTRRNITYV